MLVNYSSTIDYVGNETAQQGQFISSQELIIFAERGTINIGGCQSGCKRCVDSGIAMCTECLDGYKLHLGNCRKISGYYLKIPMTNYNNKFISLSTTDLKNNFYLEKESKFTITLWIKYFGQLDSSTTSCFVLFRFTKDGKKNICFDVNAGKLSFYNDSSPVFTDSGNFQSFIGQWCLLSISVLNNVEPTVPDLSKYFQSLYKFYVQDLEIPKVGADTSFPSMVFDSIDIGYEFSGLISDLRVYRTFMLNPYAYVTGNKKNQNLVISYTLDGKTSSSDCMSDPMLNLSSYSDLTLDQLLNTYTKKLGITCKPDYNGYISGSCSPGSFFDYTDMQRRENPCNQCDYNCLDNCAGKGGRTRCQCDLSTANQILRFDKNVTSHYCDTLPYMDLSKSDSLDLSPVKAAKTGEYSIEFWFYLYSYKQDYVAFDSEEIIWDQHLYMRIYNSNNTLGTTCNPVFVIDKAGEYMKYGKDELLSKGGLYTWVYVSCSVSIPSKVFNTVKGNSYSLETPATLIPDYSKLQNTKLTIRAGAKARINYGFLFIKDIKLWSLFDISSIQKNC